LHDTPARIRGLAVWCWCLDEREISARLREAVAHQRLFATMRYTNPPLVYFIEL